MSNHYHLALHTPEPNLVEGMKWLQSVFATRFNRFRKESGHVFQGRYKALYDHRLTARPKRLSPFRYRMLSTESPLGPCHGFIVNVPFKFLNPRRDLEVSLEQVFAAPGGEGDGA